MERNTLRVLRAMPRMPALLTTNYIVSETVKLLQFRIGFEAARVWYRDVLGVMEVRWVDEAIHRQAYELWVNLGRQRSSIVDCASYITMHQNQVEKAFCFKASYAGHGFEVIPQQVWPLK